ncbi:MAG: hypothetical protein OXC02_06260 [Rhodobacteraceae bacterium]|nr:hypothetical protein [Paracoccaceae bacterium]
MTTGISSWALDLAGVGAIYPFQGLEFLFLIIGLVFWIWWHIVCFKMELNRQEEKIKKYGNSKSIKKAIEYDH